MKFLNSTQISFSGPCFPFYSSQKHVLHTFHEHNLFLNECLKTSCLPYLTAVLHITHCFHSHRHLGGSVIRPAKKERRLTSSIDNARQRFIKNLTREAGQMAQHLRVCIALTETLGLIPSTHIRWFTSPCSSSSGRAMPSGFSGHPQTHDANKFP